MRLALDANLALLLVIGLHSEKLIERHKRLAFTNADFRLLKRLIEKASGIQLTPNALTEVSNIAGFGLSSSDKSAVTAKLAQLIPNWDEDYVPSKNVVQQKEFAWLGLSDTAWLCVLDEGMHLLTVDHDLHVAALRRGLGATNFNHLREQNGTI
jgi:hypothetical protein